MNKFFFKLRNFDEETCEETDPIRFRGARDKFNKVRDKLVARVSARRVSTGQRWMPSPTV